MFNMIKAAFVVAITLTLTTTQAQAQQTEYEVCEEGAELVQEIARDRDEGVGAERVIQTLMLMGFPQQTAMGVAWTIYVYYEDETPEEIFAQFMNTCLSEGT